MKTKNNTTDSSINADKAILENPMEWRKMFNNKWLSHFKNTGEINWRKYRRARNRKSISGLSISLSESKIMLISSAGAYLPEIQPPFDQHALLGDFSFRAIPSDTKFEDLKFSHTHYDHQFIDKDPQVLLPLRHMEDFANEGLIGELSPITISFSGYQPNAIRVVKELIPAILDLAKKHEIDGVLLVPA